jgi:hypothetical protein
MKSARGIFENFQLLPRENAEGEGLFFFKKTWRGLL